jgi:hypothetical protein
MMATTEPPWLVTPEKVHAVVGRLIEMAHPKQIILFGSYGRGKITEDSDLDVLIVAGDEVENTRRESVLAWQRSPASAKPSLRPTGR